MPLFTPPGGFVEQGNRLLVPHLHVQTGEDALGSNRGDLVGMCLQCGISKWLAVRVMFNYRTQLQFVAAIRAGLFPVNLPGKPAVSHSPASCEQSRPPWSTTFSSRYLCETDALMKMAHKKDTTGELRMVVTSR
ncbi:hypothetical protein G7046_g259 [Stylonectria norvegica]|nr:hypothetical protein G7046_g259 [Stylonectria norvegica]